MHYLANIVTGPEGKGEAVLIRSLIPVDGIGVMKKNRGQASPAILTNGPAKLCQAFSIDKSFNGINLLAPTANIFLEFGLDEKIFQLKEPHALELVKTKRPNGGLSLLESGGDPFRLWPMVAIMFLI